jgi:hypothetical protein
MSAGEVNHEAVRELSNHKCGMFYKKACYNRLLAKENKGRDILVVGTFRRTIAFTYFCIIIFMEFIIS